jgi:hypothetical protein
MKPTTYLEDASLEDVKKIIERLLEELSRDENMRAIYVGKSESEMESVGQNPR